MDAKETRATLGSIRRRLPLRRKLIDRLAAWLIRPTVRSRIASALSGNYGRDHRDVNRDIVVIGASKGGIEAVSLLASALPADLPASLMVVIHTSAQSPRLLADMIGRRTALKVSYGQQEEKIERGHVYIAPPDRHLAFGAPGWLRLDAGAPEHFHRPAADVLFRSAAATFGARVIGVVLSGGDGDGATGCAAIKTAGGVTIVQDPLEAKDPGMPLSALREDHPDFKATLDAMGDLLIRLVGPSH